MAAIPTDLDEAAKPRKWIFCPNGYPATSIMTRGYAGQHLKVERSGELVTDGMDDFPNMETFTGINGAEFLSDQDANEFLATHCRMVEVPDDFDPGDYYDGDGNDGPPIEAWPEDIQQACKEAAALQDMMRLFRDFRGRMPPGFEDDTIKVVLDKFVETKTNGLWGELEMKIARFRKGRTEPKAIDQQHLAAD